MTDRLRPSPTVSRREFLKLGGLALFGLAARNPVVGPLMRILTPSPLPPVEPTKGWEIPNIEERKNFLANPKSFIEPSSPSGEIIITPQFDDNQYKRLKPEYSEHLESANYKGNSCSEAVIATVLKIFTYFNKGEVPNVTIADVINELMDVTYQGYDLIKPNNTLMQDDPLKWAIQFYGDKTGLFSTVPLTPDWGLDNTHAVPTSEWSKLFKYSEKNVLDKGGVLVARVLKYDGAHFIVISSFNDVGESLIVDSIGPYKNHIRQGDASTIALGNYVERQPGLLWMAGVVPTF